MEGDPGGITGAAGVADSGVLSGGMNGVTFGEAIYFSNIFRGGSVAESNYLSG